MKINIPAIALILILLVLIIYPLFQSSAIRNLLDNFGITGATVGNVTVEVLSVTEITLVNGVVNFGFITPGGTNNTLTNNPAPFKIRNDGTVFVNVTMARDTSSTALFSGSNGGDNSSSFQFKLGNHELICLNNPCTQTTEGTCAILACSKTAFTNVPGISPLLAVCFLNNSDTCDEVEIDLLINVSTDEAAGVKTESLVFTAVQA